MMSSWGRANRPPPGPFPRTETPPIRAPRPTVLRAAAAVAAGVAAWGPGLPGTDAPAVRVLLADVSWSADRAAPRSGDVPQREAGDLVATVAFGADAVVLGPGATSAPPGASPSPWGTRLAAALRAAAALRPPGSRLVLHLASDGRFTDAPGEIERAVASIVRSGGAELVWDERLPSRRASVVREVRGPGRAVAGEEFAIEVAGVAAEDGATVELVGDGRVADTRRVDASGPFRLVFRRLADAPGTTVWTARTRESPGLPEASAPVVVAEPGAVALLHAGEVRPSLVAAAGRVGVAMDLRDAGAESVAAALAGHDAVVIDDAGGAARAAVAALRDWVVAGGGVLVVGGSSSFAADPAAHGESGLDAISPLLSAPPQGDGTLLYLAIDGSGSMAEPWPGAAGGVARDAAVRAAALELARGVPDGTRFVLRRFRETLVPSGPPASIDLGPGPRDAAADVVRGLADPGGSTAFGPVLAEALDVAGAAGGRTRSVVLLTDGRSSEDAAALRRDVERLLATGVRLTVVVPGALPAGESDASLLRAVAGLRADVRPANDPAALVRALAESERSARVGDPFAGPVALEIASAGAEILTARDVPGRALRVVRSWPSADAAICVRSRDGLPFAAIRDAGAGRVAAVAARLPDSRWADGDGGAALVRAMVRAVRRRGAATVRVEPTDDGFRVRVDARPGAAAPDRAVLLSGGREVARAGLVPEGDGIWRARGIGAVAADAVRIESERGAEIATAGLGTPAPAECLDVPVADVGAIAARLAPAGPSERRSSRGPAAALAVLLLVAASAGSVIRVKSPVRPAR